MGIGWGKGKSKYDREEEVLVVEQLGGGSYHLHAFNTRHSALRKPLSDPSEWR